MHQKRYYLSKANLFIYNGLRHVRIRSTKRVISGVLLIRMGQEGLRCGATGDARILVNMAPHLALIRSLGSSVPFGRWLLP